ncbi:hypothetical protein GCM10007874_45200 [Labrys miyagiensis]|uniref:Uncharacterized protein n=1 Tax=Labrys miyagiensis TaxID=346912 RepID=A0ABQ6CP03_9HYPH|nr:hypothetical protein GCM10007874_45200 [Labrys miyagiensis]
MKITAKKTDDPPSASDFDRWSQISGQTKNKSHFGGPKPAKSRPEDPQQNMMSLVRFFEKSHIFS